MTITTTYIDEVRMGKLGRVGQKKEKKTTMAIFNTCKFYKVGHNTIENHQGDNGALVDFTNLNY